MNCIIIFIPYAIIVPNMKTLCEKESQDRISSCRSGLSTCDLDLWLCHIGDLKYLL